MLSVLTMVVTDRSGPCPCPREGAVPLGWPVQGEPFMAREALRHPNTKPLVPGPEVTMIQLDLSRTQHVWERERFGGTERRMKNEEKRMQERREGWKESSTSRKKAQQLWTREILNASPSTLPLHVARDACLPLANLMGDHSPSALQSLELTGKGYWPGLQW